MPNSQKNIAEMEWLWHVDLGLSKYVSEDELTADAKIAWSILKSKSSKGCRLVMALVRVPEGIPDGMKAS